MNRFLIAVVSVVFAGCNPAGKLNKASLQHIPATILGDFRDDYDIHYSISDSVWVQQPNVRYRLLKYDSAGRYFIARNAMNNPSEGGLYSRIDIMFFTGMEPWTWGFCLTAYDAKSFEEAVAVAAADRDNPKKGCGGFPFSRMKKISN